MHGDGQLLFCLIFQKKRNPCNINDTPSNKSRGKRVIQTRLGKVLSACRVYAGELAVGVQFGPDDISRVPKGLFTRE